MPKHIKNNLVYNSGKYRRVVNKCIDKRMTLDEIMNVLKGKYPGFNVFGRTTLSVYVRHIKAIRASGKYKNSGRRKEVPLTMYGITMTRKEFREKTSDNYWEYVKRMNTHFENKEKQQKALEEEHRLWKLQEREKQQKEHERKLAAQKEREQRIREDQIAARERSLMMDKQELEVPPTQQNVSREYGRKGLLKIKENRLQEIVDVAEKKFKDLDTRRIHTIQSIKEHKQANDDLNTAINNLWRFKNSDEYLQYYGNNNRSRTPRNESKAEREERWFGCVDTVYT